MDGPPRLNVLSGPANPIVYSVEAGERQHEVRAWRQALSAL